MHSEEAVMANSKYEYVKDFEVQDNLMPHTWIVIRIDGRGFTKYALLTEKLPPLVRILILLTLCVTNHGMDGHGCEQICAGSQVPEAQ